ncbi:MAG: beta-lactamase family protein [Actinobacteria bacterium]|nr:beta-lactamase family protein [Actinomycetota bacterium]
MASPLVAIDQWRVDAAAAVVLTTADQAEGDTASRAEGDTVRVAAQWGDLKRRFPLASVTKLLSALAVLVAVEEGSIALDGPAGPAGSTVRHLLAHASGLGPDGAVLTRPGRRRIYSNAGFEVVAAHVERATSLGFAAYLREAVLAPLGMEATTLDGSPASGATSTASDLGRLAAELLAPGVVAAETLTEATSVQLPGLDGVLPGFGRQSPCDWGLGFEIRDGKDPHWTAPSADPRTFGHFGQSGTFLWVDPAARVACAVLTDRPFGPWARQAWPALGEEVLRAFRLNRLSDRPMKEK